MPSDKSHFLNFLLKEYPSQDIIDSKGIVFEKLKHLVKDKLKSEDSNPPLDCLIIRGESKILKLLAESLERSKLEVKLNLYTGFLVVDMPESDTHKTMCGLVSGRIEGALANGFNLILFPQQDKKVSLGRGAIMPDCSFYVDEPIPNEEDILPGIIVEITVAENIAHVTEKCLDWLEIISPSGRHVDVAIVVKPDFRIRNDGVDRHGSTSIYAKVITCITFSLYRRQDLTLVNGQNKLVERQTVKLSVEQAGNRVEFVNPVCLLSRRRDRNDDYYRGSRTSFGPSDFLSIPRNTFEAGADEVRLLDRQTLHDIVRRIVRSHENSVVANDHRMGWH